MKKIIKSTNDLLLALIMGGLSVFLLVSDQTVTGKTNGMGGFWAQASTYISLLASMLLAMSILQLIYAINFKGDDSKFSKLYIPVNREIVITAAALILYALLLPVLTFFPCTLTLTIVLTGTFMMKENSGTGDRKLSKKQIIIAIVYSSILTVALYLIFTYLLKCVLP